MTQEPVRQRNFLLDDMKLLASYFVVFIHCMFPGDFGIAVKAVARFAVPFFFLCSGYFLYGNTPEKICQKTWRIAKLLLFAVLVYVCADVCNYAVAQDFEGLQSYFLSFIAPKKLRNLILFNDSLVGAHLWYLFATVYVYGIYYFIEKHRLPDSLTVTASAALLVLHLLIWHAFLVFEITTESFLVRNFLFVGFPFVSLGRVLKKYQAKLVRQKGTLYFLCIVGGTVLSLLSRFSFGEKSLPFGAIVIAITLMLVCITGNHPERQFARNAGTYSTYIYLFHPLIMTWYRKLIGSVNVQSSVWQNLAPVAVCLGTTVIAVLCVWLQKRLRASKPAVAA